MHDWPTDTSKVPTPTLVAAWLVLDTLPIERVPLWAAHWIADGQDGESLRRLAGLSGKDPHDIRDLLGDALRECGVDDRDISPGASAERAAAMEAFTAVARLQVSGRASERWVVSKVYEMVEPEFDPDITRLPLGRLFGLDDEWSAGWGRTDDELRAEVRRACRDQLVAAFGASTDELLSSPPSRFTRRVCQAGVMATPRISIETERLLLRRPEADDAAVHRKMWTERDSRVPPHRRIGSDGRPTVAEIADSLRAQHDDPKAALLTVVRKHEGDVIGYCGLIFHGRGPADEPELAYELLRDAQGLGYATEAARAVLDWAAECGHRRVWAGVRRWNVASLRVLEKLAFVDTGQDEPDAQYGDSVVWTRTW